MRALDSGGYLDQPLGRVGVRRGVEGRCVRRAHPRERARVTRRRNKWRVRREGGDLDEEGRALRLLDEFDCRAREHIGHIIARFPAVVDDLAIFIQRVVELGIAEAADVPFVPPHRGAVPRRLIAVQIFSEHGSLVADALKCHRESVRLITVGVEAAVAAVRFEVTEHSSVMRKLAGEDRRARRAAKRIGDEVIRKGGAVALHLLHVRHELQQVQREIVSEHEDDIRALQRRRLRGRNYPRPSRWIALGSRLLFNENWRPARKDQNNRHKRQRNEEAWRSP